MRMWKRMIRKFSIKGQIFIMYSSIFICAIIIFSMIVTRSFNTAAKKTEEKNTERELELIINNLDMMISDCEEYLKVISTDVQLIHKIEEYEKLDAPKSLEKLKYRNDINKILSNIIYPNTKMIGASVIHGQEVLCASYSIKEESAEQIMDEAYEKSVAQTPGCVWDGLSILSYNDQNDEYVIAVSKEIMNKDTGRVKGIITLYLQETQLERIYQKNNTKGNEYYILDNQGRVLSSVDKKLLKQAYTGTVPKEGYWVTKKEYPRLGWEIICHADQSILKKANMEMMTSNLVLLLVIAAAVFLGAYFVSAAITRPLYELMRVMKRIEAGEEDARVHDDATDEIGTLSREFNKLVDGQQAAMQQIYAHQRAKRKSELLLLQSQIKPHFLYNAMETIASFVKLNYKEQAMETIKSLSAFYRESLSNGREIVEVANEVEIIQEYLKIQSLRYQNYLEYTVDVEEDVLHYKIPKLILQPLVENSIYHGIKQKDEMGEIIIRGYEKDETLCFEVFDTGIGMTDEKKMEILEKLSHNDDTSGRDSFGLYNVAQRLQLFYGEDSSLLIESCYQEYTQVTIKIPKKE